MAIKKGDTVSILAGKDRGKTGKVVRVDAKEKRVVVEGLNLVKKHVRPKKQGEKGEVVSMPRAVDISNIAVICSSCKKPTRLGSRMDGETKVRVCAKCKASI